MKCNSQMLAPLVAGGEYKMEIFLPSDFNPDGLHFRKENSPVIMRLLSKHLRINILKGHKVKNSGNL